MKKFVFILALIQGISAMLEQGAFEVNMTQDQNLAVFTKSMYNGTQIAVKLHCNQEIPVQIQISWLLRWTPCAQEYSDIDTEPGIAMAYFENPEVLRGDLPYQFVKYQKYVGEVSYTCGEGHFIDLIDHSRDGYNVRNGTRLPVVTSDQKKSLDDNKDAVTKTKEGKSRAKRQSPLDVGAGTTLPPLAASSDKFHKITRTWENGIYLFILKIDVKAGDMSKYDTTVDVRMKGPHGGYLSAIEWPLLPFYGVMCVVYVIFGVIWLLLSACNWRDLLRIQFWIGGVIFLGMLEKAIFFSEHETINTTGHSVKGAMLFGELVSCLKRTLARMLVIIVSLGFGIVKPRLGPMLHKVLAMGGLYFILSAVEGCLRVLKPKSDQSNQTMLAAIPLAVLDAAICCWIFTGLVNTIRTLRLRRNLIKLGLYRHFTNTLIFAVVASVAFMVWSITQHKFSKCLSDWTELWVDEAFWHLLFSVILMVIMILWRPSANNQRYAFSALMDAADDKAGEPMMNDAFDDAKSDHGDAKDDDKKDDEDIKTDDKQDDDKKDDAKADDSKEEDQKDVATPEGIAAQLNLEVFTVLPLNPINPINPINSINSINSINPVGQDKTNSELDDDFIDPGISDLLSQVDNDDVGEVENKNPKEDRAMWSTESTKNMIHYI